MLKGNRWKNNEMVHFLKALDNQKVCINFLIYETSISLGLQSPTSYHLETLIGKNRSDLEHQTVWSLEWSGEQTLQIKNTEETIFSNLNQVALRRVCPLIKPLNWESSPDSKSSAWWMLTVYKLVKKKSLKQVRIYLNGFSSN